MRTSLISTTLIATQQLKTHHNLIPIGMDIGGSNGRVAIGDKIYSIDIRSAKSAKEILEKLKRTVETVTKQPFPKGLSYVAIAGPQELDGSIRLTSRGDGEEWRFTTDLIDKIFGGISIMGNDADGMMVSAACDPKIYWVPWSGAPHLGNSLLEKSQSDDGTSFGLIGIGTGVATGRTNISAINTFTLITINRSERQHLEAHEKTPTERLILDKLNEGKSIGEGVSWEYMLRGDGLEVIFNTLLDLGEISGKRVKKRVNQAREKRIPPALIITDFALGTNKSGYNEDKNTCNGCVTALEVYLGMHGGYAGDTAQETNVVIGGIASKYTKQIKDKTGPFARAYEGKRPPKFKDMVMQRPIHISGAQAAFGNLKIANAILKPAELDVIVTDP